MAAARRCNHEYCGNTALAGVLAQLACVLRHGRLTLHNQYLPLCPVRREFEKQVPMLQSAHHVVMDPVSSFWTMQAVKFSALEGELGML